LITPTRKASRGRLRWKRSIFRIPRSREFIALLPLGASNVDTASGPRSSCIGGYVPDRPVEATKRAGFGWRGLG
jgi:hypothetical protein